ncbi:MAG: HPF/RaiA family ribosome-associated protein [Myxococcales bacterium]|nr:HPF/RaiA family ribosome-associated protein [Myxococcota bacterium]MDW8284225.1 HPF/RaiA family ribosome-associated protein [Myxococcales bacterium]
MSIPLQITTSGGLTLSESIENDIRERVESLGRFFDRILGCRVVVEAPARHHRLGAFAVRIEIAVPGHDLVVSRIERADLALALRDSFDAARRQLEQHAERLRGEVKAHSVPPAAEPT